MGLPQLGDLMRLQMMQNPQLMQNPLMQQMASSMLNFPAHNLMVALSVASSITALTHENLPLLA